MGNTQNKGTDDISAISSGVLWPAFIFVISKSLLAFYCLSVRNKPALPLLISRRLEINLPICSKDLKFNSPMYKHNSIKQLYDISLKNKIKFK